MARTSEKVQKILDRLDEEYGTDYKCYLNHENAWQLLIATMLSAQCTDARVNIVTEDLFKKVPVRGCLCECRSERAGKGYSFHGLLP